MTVTKHFALMLFLTIFALSVSASAQAPSIEVTTGGDSAQFSAQGRVESLRLQVFSPAGDLVFEAEATAGQPLRWPLTDRKGARVADGVYRAHVTYTDPSGKLHARVEQVSVGSQATGAVQAAAPAPQESLAPTGAGTAGRLAKWTTSTNLGNSVITESAAGNVGVNTAPTAVLQVHKAQPAAASGDGTHAPLLLATTGGRGGNTTGAGTTAGRGASIALYAGRGGDAVAGSTNGPGGSITLQPGSPGAGGAGGVSGNVLLAPQSGKVGVGTNNPAGKLHVEGGSSTAVAARSINGTGVAGVGVSNGSVTYFRGLNLPTGVSGYSDTGIGVHGVSNSGYAGYFQGKVIVNGNVGVGTTAPARPVEIANGQLRFSSAFGDVEFTEVADLVAWTTAPNPDPNQPAFRVHAGTNHPLLFTVLNDGRVGIGMSKPLAQLHSFSGGQAGVWGDSTSNAGVFGRSTSHNGVWGRSHNSDLNSDKAGVYGDNPSGGWAGYFSGPVKVTGNLYVNGAVNPPSDRNVKADFAAINPRSILDRLASVPVLTWRYKSEAEDVRHIGPVAQDFRAAFALGSDDKHISTVDADGVALASIQALYRMMLERDRQIKRLQSQVQQLRRIVRRKRAARKT